MRRTRWGWNSSVIFKLEFEFHTSPSSNIIINLESKPHGTFYMHGKILFIVLSMLYYLTAFHTHSPINIGFDILF
ncbi:hypothetical protein PUN28_012684 [Cardiocondyla obscurior]|uniref:Uncharacterized protein n=2 Tax=Cardiocondyla obscurior TaxID=286306 RepID=A0AAW2FEQ7_9HYME